MTTEHGYIGPLEGGEWRRLTPLTAQDWADLIEAIRPPTAWSDHGATVRARLMDHDDAEFAMRTLAPVVARIAERWADLREPMEDA